MPSPAAARGAADRPVAAPVAAEQSRDCSAAIASRSAAWCIGSANTNQSATRSTDDRASLTTVPLATECHWRPGWHWWLVHQCCRVSPVTACHWLCQCSFLPKTKHSPSQQQTLSVQNRILHQAPKEAERW